MDYASSSLRRSPIRVPAPADDLRRPPLSIITAGRERRRRRVTVYCTHGVGTCIKVTKVLLKYHQFFSSAHCPSVCLSVEIQNIERFLRHVHPALPAVYAGPMAICAPLKKKRRAVQEVFAGRYDSLLYTVQSKGSTPRQGL